jgi:hypothetical protein
MTAQRKPGWWPVAAISIGLASSLAHATPSEADVANAVKFSLQCNASIGTIEDVELTGSSPGRDRTYVIRGTYKQRVGGFNLFGMQSAERNGGVFEGVYDSTARKLVELQFKISLRHGSVVPNCLR